MKDSIKGRTLTALKSTAEIEDLKLVNDQLRERNGFDREIVIITNDNKDEDNFLAVHIDVGFTEDREDFQIWIGTIEANFQDGTQDLSLDNEVDESVKQFISKHIVL